MFGAGLGGRAIVWPPGLVIWPPVMLLDPVTTPVFRLNEHDDDTAAARSEPCPGSATARAGILDEALTAPAVSVMIPGAQMPAVSALGRITGEPPE